MVSNFAVCLGGKCNPSFMCCCRPFDVHDSSSFPRKASCPLGVGIQIGVCVHRYWHSVSAWWRTVRSYRVPASTCGRAARSYWIPASTCGRAARGYWIPASTCGRVANYPIRIVNASYQNSVKLFPALSLDRQGTKLCLLLQEADSELSQSHPPCDVAKVQRFPRSHAPPRAPQGIIIRASAR